MDLLGANLHQAYLQADYLREVQFADADLTGANFTAAHCETLYLDGARVNSTTLWPDDFDLSPFDLEIVVALETYPPLA